MAHLLEGQVAIITGAARGQGAAEARLFVAEGARVVATDVKSEAGAALVAGLGDQAHFVKHDVTQEADWRTVVEATLARFGRIDILINNAGIVTYDTIIDSELAELQRLLAVHLFGAHLGIKAVLPAMRVSGGGSIVNIASAAALRGHTGLYSYGVSKWALRGLSRYAAVDLAPLNIRVNAILPGGVETEMLSEKLEGIAVQKARDTVPLKRFATAEEIARTALFLCTEAASYMTGAELVVDGGVSA